MADVPIRKRTLSEALDYVARDLLDNPGRYGPLAMAILLGQFAGDARALEEERTAATGEAS